MTAVLQDLFDVLDQMQTANRRNSRKSQPVVDWFDNEFSVSAKASLVTEAKQTYNRVVEQFKHNASHVVFVVLDPAALRPLATTIRQKWYSNLASVLIIESTGPGIYQNPLLFEANDNSIDQFYRQNLQSLEEESVVTSGDSQEITAVAEVLEPKWDVTVPIDYNGIIGSEKHLQLALSALKQGKHVIFSGPPGTGKTQLALALTKLIQVPSDLATATSEWSTFETIGGYFPSLSDDQSQMSQLDFNPGIVVRAIEKGAWLIIDELNRADVDKAFGELFTLLSGVGVRLPYRKLDDNRFKELQIIYEGQTIDPDSFVVTVPTNWRILATMNTLDKASLYQLSYAFMRRFAFIDVEIPESQAYSKILRTAAAKLLPHNDYEQFSDRVFEYIETIFVGSNDSGLSSCGVHIGPAIALDCLSLAGAQLRTCTPQTLTDETLQDLVQRSLQAFLFPQLEGRDNEHEGIMNCLSETLGLDSARKEILFEKLASWTGYEL